jgi:hypothetical protein
MKLDDSDAKRDRGWRRDQHEPFQEAYMKTTRTLTHDLETLAWGGIFLWWGITELFKLPNGADALGIGLILLGVNAARLLNGMPTNGFSLTLGILALVWGVLDLARALVRLPFELPVFAILLIVLGATLLARELLQARRTSFEGTRASFEDAR